MRRPSQMRSQQQRPTALPIGIVPLCHQADVWQTQTSDAHVAPLVGMTSVDQCASKVYTVTVYHLQYWVATCTGHRYDNGWVCVLKVVDEGCVSCALIREVQAIIIRKEQSYCRSVDK